MCIEVTAIEFAARIPMPGIRPISAVAAVGAPGKFFSGEGAAGRDRFPPD